MGAGQWAGGVRDALVSEYKAELHGTSQCHQRMPPHGRRYVAACVFASPRASLSVSACVTITDWHVGQCWRRFQADSISTLSTSYLFRNQPLRKAVFSCKAASPAMMKKEKALEATRSQELCEVKGLSLDWGLA